MIFRSPCRPNRCCGGWTSWAIWAHRSITISGGEPLLHPQLDDIIHHMRQRRIVSGLITNGYLLTADRIQRLNRAGLEWLQISIDNVNPDEVSKKSLKVLDRKLQLLAEHADFHVNINSVVGGGVSHPQDALTIGKRALELGFSSTIGIIHDGSGQVQPLTDEERRVYHEMKELEKRSFTRVNAFQDNIALGRPNQWRCRAGARYLYICEDGLVHYCSQQRGYPAIPLEKYTIADMRREFHTEKPCAPHCTVSCVHQVSVLDAWRAPQWPAPASEPAAGWCRLSSGQLSYQPSVSVQPSTQIAAETALASSTCQSSRSFSDLGARRA